MLQVLPVAGTIGPRWWRRRMWLVSVLCGRHEFCMQSGGCANGIRASCAAAGNIVGQPCYQVVVL
jgi:hypothetical protein